ncbi:hypothetical protein T4B_12078, partial [Trichinella pseudospiralis]
MRNQSSFNSKNVDCRIRNYGFGLELDSTSERQALVHPSCCFTSGNFLHIRYKHSTGVDACLPAWMRAYSSVVVVILNSTWLNSTWLVGTMGKVFSDSLGQHSSASLTGASLGQTTLTYV